LRIAKCRSRIAGEPPARFTSRWLVFIGIEGSPSAIHPLLSTASNRLLIRDPQSAIRN
jgi:hypothetical protein